MYSNLFLSERPLGALRAQYYYLTEQIEPKDFYRIVKGFENRLLRHGVVAATLGDKVLVPEGATASGSIRIPSGVPFSEAEDFLVLTPQQHGGVVANLVLNALKIRAHSLGYLGPEGGKFFKESPYRIDFFTFHDAFSTDVELLPDGRVGIWIDPTTRWKQKVIDFLAWLKGQKYSDAEVYSHLIGREVYCPSTRGMRFKAEVADVTFKPISQFEMRVKGLRTNVYDYWTTQSQEHVRWLQNNQISLNPLNMPVVSVQVKGIPDRLSFPSEVLEMVIELEDEMPAEALAEKRILSPVQRITETKQLVQKLLKEDLSLGSTALTFSKELLEWTSDLGRSYGKTLPLRAPNLLFGGDGVGVRSSDWTDPDILSALAKFGPFTRKAETKIHYLVPGTQADLVEKFHEWLASHGLHLKLSQFILGEIETIERDSPDSYLRACRGIQVSGGQVVIVVLPHIATSAYFASKRGLGENNVKSQMLRGRTFEEIAKSDATQVSRVTPFLYNIAAQVYDKALSPGESIWHLRDSAGGLDPSRVIYFMGFDVSRAPERRKEAAAYAAVCDSYGRIIYRKVIDSHKGEKIQSHVLSDWFFDVASSAFDQTKGTSRAHVDELILFKDGPIPRNQVVDYRKGAQEAKSRLMDEDVMDVDANIRIISVIKKGPHRVYGKERYQYRTKNTAIVRDSTNAIIVTAEARQGTALPLKLRLEEQLTSNMDIEQILYIFNDLRYLDYTSLFRQPKTALPLHIVQNLAKLSKEDIHVPYIPR